MPALCTEAKSEKVRLNRITISKIRSTEIPAMEAGVTKTVKAADFSKAKNAYVLASGIVTGTENETALDYPVAVAEDMEVKVSFDASYSGRKNPELEVSKVAADGSESRLTSIAVTKDQKTTKEADIVLPKGTYTLRVTMKNDGVDLENMIFCGKEKKVPAEGIALDAYELVLNPGESFQMNAKRTPEGATSAITWSSSDASVAKVENGKITAVKNGTAVITAEANGHKAECKVIVGERQAQPDIPKTVPTFIKKVFAEVQAATLYAGGNDNSTKVRIVVPTGAKLAKTEYGSSDMAVAEVTAAGLVKAKKAGNAVITAKVTLTNGETADLKVSVTVKKAYIKLKKANYSVKNGKSVTIKAAVYGSTKKVNFKIANKAGKKLAKVTKNGKLTGKKKGSVKVTAYAGKVKKTFIVKVK